MTRARNVEADGTVLAIAFVISLALMVWPAFVFSRLWGWFVAPTIGLPEIALGEAVGLLLLLGLTVSYFRRPDVNRLTIAEAAHGIVTTITAPALALGLGAVVHWIVG